jgi:hypothetical protein
MTGTARRRGPAAGPRGLPLAVSRGARGEMFCTRCLANALLATNRIDRVVMTAEGRGAVRRHGDRASCGNHRLLGGLAAS